MLTADRFVRSGKVRDLYAIGDDRLLLVASDRLPEPILTPATKAETGHDENIDRAAMVEAIAAVAGGESRRLADRVEAVALDLYGLGAATCARAGILLADTKFEMGLVDGE